MISSENRPSGSVTSASAATLWSRLKQFLLENRSSIIAYESDNEKNIHLYSLGNLWLAFDRSAWQLNLVFQDIPVSTLRFQDAASPLVMTHISETTLRELVKDNPSKTITPDHVILSVSKLNLGEYKLWRANVLDDHDMKPRTNM